MKALSNLIILIFLRLVRRVLFIVMTLLLVKYKKFPKRSIIISISAPLGYKTEDLESVKLDISELKDDIRFIY